MICTTIQGKTYEEICEILDNCEMAEIRLDRCDLSLQETHDIFESEVPLVATCRVAEVSETWGREQGKTSPEAECEARLIEAVKAGAAFVDVEVEAPKELMKRVRSAAHKYGTVLIVSSHDFARTGTYSELKTTVERCFRFGADLVKIVTSARSAEDPQRIAALYDDFDPANLIAFCMGEKGRQSRLDCLKYGARYTYAALSENDPAAPGQWSAAEMMRAVYGDTRPFGTAAVQDEEAQSTGRDIPIRMPASKSFAQRAIIAAAFADGESHFYGYTPCSDSEAALNVALALGAKVTVTPTGRKDIKTDIQDYKYNHETGTSPDQSYTITILGIGAQAGSVDITELNVGESGLLTRLMIPLTAMVSTSDVTLRGEKTLLSRSLKGASEMMSRFGVYLSGETVPLKISGTLSEGRAEITGRYGSQLISGLLMAEPLAGGSSVITVTEPKSIPYMFITLDVLKQFGVQIRSEMGGGSEFLESEGDWSRCTDITFKIRGNQNYRAADIDLEADWSAAANFLVAGAIFGRVTVEGLDTTSLQADISIMDILIDAGAGPVQLDDDKGPIVIRKAPLTAFDTDASDCPDLFPILSVLAAFCQGTSRITGVDRLSHKESDRGAAIVQMLSQMGVETRIEGNSILIEGHSLAQRRLTGTLLKGGCYTSHHDHRMAMALKVASLGADSPLIIDDEACVAKSFPAFFDIFRKLS
ncbi:MAG: type I 3-dehydroquinate dehydratase [Bacteroidales bacterium]|nr:type I 3-dehydroquinate dehydratase [Bacteroidales bacterium]